MDKIDLRDRVAIELAGFGIRMIIFEANEDNLGSNGQPILSVKDINEWELQTGKLHLNANWMASAILNRCSEEPIIRFPEGFVVPKRIKTMKSKLLKLIEFRIAEKAS